MEKGVNREIYLNYFIDRLFCCIQQNPCEKCVSFESVRERAIFATDIYFRLLAIGKDSSYALDKAFSALFSGYNTVGFNPFQ